MYAPLTNVQYDSRSLRALPKEIEANYQLYLESYENATMPFYIGVPQDGCARSLRLNWDVSYDFDAEKISSTP